MASTLFTAATIVGVVFILIVLFIIYHKKEHNKKLAMQQVVFADVVWKNKLEIIEKESINNYLLAIDKLNFVLVYINFNDPKPEVQLIDLWNVKFVKVASEDNTVYEQKNGKTIVTDRQIVKLQLEVTLANDQSNYNLLLYQYKDGMQDLMQIKKTANHWAGIINECVKALPHPAKQNLHNA
jgi:G3E family GTPase